ncbi:MAG: TolC family protein [Longimicrobiales bacterium]
MNTRTSLLAGAFLLAAVRGAFAQDVPAVLTLDDALRLARQNNPTYRQSLNDANVASIGVKQGWAAFLPSLSTSMNFGLNSSTSGTGEGDFGQPVENPEPITYRGSSASQGVSLNLTLFDGGAMFRGLAEARARERATGAQISMAGSTVDAQVTRDFYASQRTRLLVDVELRNLATARTRLEDTQQRFRIAAADQVDLLDAEQSVIRVEQQLATAEAGAATTRLALGQTIGIDPGLDFELTDVLPEVFDPSALDAETLVALALERSPSVAQGRATLEAQRLAVSAARGSRWPSITGGFGYSRSTSQQGFGAFGDINPNSRYGWGFNVAVSLPVFQRFNTSAQIAQAEASREDAEYALRGAQIEVEKVVREQLIELERLYRNFETQQRLATLSEQQVTLAEEQYRLGARDFLQFQTIVDNNAEAQRQVVQARFDFVNALVTLEQTLGAPVDR